MNARSWKRSVRGHGEIADYSELPASQKGTRVTTFELLALFGLVWVIGLALAIWLEVRDRR